VASETNQPRRGPSDATDAPSNQAPGTVKAAEEAHEAPGGDYRLWPGGAHGAHVDTGMSSLDEEVMASDPHGKSLIPHR